MVGFCITEAEFDKVVFLYQLERGQAAASYGLNVASLAGLPNSLLQLAHIKSKQFEEEILQRTRTLLFPVSCDLAMQLHSLLDFLTNSREPLPHALRNHTFTM